MVITDATATNIALPNITLSLHANLADLQWIVGGYTLTFACFLIFAGYLTDRLGARTMFLFGLILFSITSIACGLSTIVGALISFRLLQGISAAILVPASLSLINSNYSNQKDRACAIGIWGSAGGIAAAGGPIFGGLLTSGFGWPAVFFINVPIGIISVIVVYKNVYDASIRENYKFDILGQIIGFIAVTLLMYFLVELGNQGHSLSGITIMIGGSGIFALSLFIYIEIYSSHPILSLTFFREKNFSISMIIGVLINIGLYGTLFILPLYFQQIKGYNTLKIGLSILPMLVLVSISSYLSGKVIALNE
ncbi:Spectinomycin tetracycline efflux pump [Piscirickettsia salmonis]|uniref:Spectinomycin tetracycline efflux pump n=2 Tax=Piscirickettsia salmonis TaxID=1238 RepID=A0A9Q6LQK2_PISSA|nr:MFS transporter [Piscirickettsia salmonis]ALA25056.1 sugar (and other) transporter family protein [Piscirickettsia salmonis]QGN95025.1 Spectinomycin tetracycline efflux pump [Piscirickettsia salmonis]QGO06025.1 Spectinomycin tetracycline efflux pump [Piscirickettsia salmonis]QGO34350.1 Spectinomycin tetracycline efflux pump [Piscirickettsia salmonis]QGO37957.1 Spectinomycin tetracycline efflux pump [Piscirickettsia salmonis]